LSAGIKLSEQATWWTSGLFFSQLVEQARAAYPDHEEVQNCLTNLSSVEFFSVEIYDQEFGTLLARMLYTVAKDIKDRAIEVGPVMNLAGTDLRAEYINSLDGLVAMFEVDGRYDKRLTPSDLPR